MSPLREEVPAALAGQRVDRVVSMLTGCSRSDAAAAVADGLVTVDGRVVARTSTKVVQGSVLEVELPERAERVAEADSDVAITVVHEDDRVLVVDKPAGLAVHRAPGVEGHTLVGGLLHRYPDLADVGDDPTRPGIVHRLDVGTSGLLVVARDDEAQASLIDQLRWRSVTREYSALVWGHPESDQAVIDAPLGRSRRDRTRFAVVRDGREARTRYEVEQRFDAPECTLVACRLETGRTHQIRVHMTSIGHAVVGDERYDGARSTIPLDRPFLHARRLGFDHPASGERLELTSPLPAELQAVLDRLGT